MNAPGATGSIRNHNTNTTASAAKAEVAGRAEGAGHILVVDDDSEIREIIAVLLKGVGYRVTTAADGGVGWIALCTHPYDLLIADHMMPRLTGLELLRRVRAVPLALPCILMSGAIPWEAPDLPALLSPGAVVEKPFSLLELRTKVAELLHHILNPAPVASWAGQPLAFRET